MGKYKKFSLMFALTAIIQCCFIETGKYDAINRGRKGKKMRINT